MPVQCASEGLPVLYLYNIDPDWDTHDAEAALQSNEKMVAALQEAGHPVMSAGLSNKDLAFLLSRYASRDLIVFNQCEGIPGIPYSEHEAARIIESLGFVYTGSPPDVLLLTGNKVETKQILELYDIPTPRWRVYNEPVAGDWNIFPAIVKTAREHCSISLSPESVVMNGRELESRIEYILKIMTSPHWLKISLMEGNFMSPYGAMATSRSFLSLKWIFPVFTTYTTGFVPTIPSLSPNPAIIK